MHTQGKWEVKHYHGATTKTFGGPHIQAGKRIIAWPEFPDVASNEESEANARLIAAAPELLDACRELVAWAETCSTAADRKHGAWPMFDRARAALAKANGKDERSDED